METPDENAAVISAGKVTGTEVYNTQGEHLGEIRTSCSTSARAWLAWRFWKPWRLGFIHSNLLGEATRKLMARSSSATAG